MSQCLVKLPHSCGTRKGLQVFGNDDGSVTGYCFSCKTPVPDPMGVGAKVADIPKANLLVRNPEEIQAELDEIDGYGVVDLVDRRLKAEALDAYGIKVGVSEQDGITPTFQYFPYTKKGKRTSYKVKLLDGKKFWSVGDQRDVDLFGWEQAKASGARRLIITEGENDAVALARIFEIYEKAEYKDTIPAVCSLPHGAAAAGKDLARLLPEIRKYFKEIAICFDDDEAGQAACDDVAKIVPDIKIITLPLKDANQCLIEGKGKAAYNAAKWKAEVQKNTRIVWLDSIWEDAKKPAEWGVSWPWDDLTDATRGIRTGETIYIGAAQKMG